MLGLALREEFRGRRLKGTAIELANESQTGATQVGAPAFLEITYPSLDLLKALEAVSPGQGRPLVLIGERGLGKSHVMAALHHALTDEAATQAWLNTWAGRLANAKIARIPLRAGVRVISESLHRQRYKFLWDLLFDKHPAGDFIRGKWEGMGEKKTDIPPDTLILELLRKQPVALLLDEYQTWFDGLTNTKQYPWRNWAFTFIQILSEIAKDHPDLLVLVVSVRNGGTDAFQQVNRVNPALVDFKGPNADRDRRRLLLHRLFENRLQVAVDDIESLTSTHVSEYLRLNVVPPADHARVRRDFIELWPFAPHLVQLLEDQVLVATSAQETRDLIRILADLYKVRGEISPLLTAADFRLDDEGSGITSLLDSVSNQHHANLREKAQRNLKAVLEAVPEPATTVPHVSELVGALWLRSLAVGNVAGAEPRMLQVDVTRSAPVDDNAFQVELAAVVENSFNIHQEGARLVFREEENPQAKLMATAKNDKLFEDGADRFHLAKEVRYVLSGAEDVARAFRVVVLPRDWLTAPWAGIEEADHPDKWGDERLPIVVLPEEVDRLGERLGQWLKDQLQRRRNTVRFLLPRNGSTNAYLDRDLLVLSRAVLKAQEWRAQSPEYGRLHTKYQGDLRGILKQRFDRFAALRIWSFTEPPKCRFHVEGLKAQGVAIPEAIEQRMRDDLFVPEDFEKLVLTAAANNEPLGKLLRELQEPRPNGEECIPWLGETAMKEKVLRLAARGLVAINRLGLEYLQANPGEGEDAAWMRMRGRVGTGRHLDETYILLPQAVPAAHGAPAASTAVPGPLFAGAGGGKPAAPSGEYPTSVIGGQVATPPPPALFGAGTGLRVSLSTPATSALNLLGRVEAWGVAPGTQVHTVRITLPSATGAQLQKLLKSLPDGLTYELSLEKEEG
jgi:hypothetical protein